MKENTEIIADGAGGEVTQAAAGSPENGSVKALLGKKAANLLSIKSLVTLVLTGVFAALSICGTISGSDFLTVFTVVIAFYFGTQAKKEGSGGSV